MVRSTLLTLLGVVGVCTAQSTLYDLNATDIDGNPFDMSVYKNKVTLVVNVATY